MLGITTVSSHSFRCPWINKRKFRDFSLLSQKGFVSLDVVLPFPVEQTNGRQSDGLGGHYRLICATRDENHQWPTGYPSFKELATFLGSVLVV